MGKRLIVLLLSIGVALAPAVVTEAVDDGPSKKWCRHHKKKCRKLMRRTRQGDGPRVVAFKTTRDGKVLAMQADDGPVVYAGDPALWKRDGRIPDSRKRRGCGRVVGNSDAVGSAWGLSVDLYDVVHTKFWCWRRGRVRQKTVQTSTTVLETDDWVKLEGVTKTGGPYRWRDRRNGGHFSQRQWHFQACPFWVLCPVANYYPYVRVYAHGNGSYHLSGHNW
jgi:hypothetical protein